MYYIYIYIYIHTHTHTYMYIKEKRKYYLLLLYIDILKRTVHNTLKKKGKKIYYLLLLYIDILKKTVHRVCFVIETSSLFFLSSLLFSSTECVLLWKPPVLFPSFFFFAPQSVFCSGSLVFILPLSFFFPPQHRQDAENLFSALFPAVSDAFPKELPPPARSWERFVW